MRNLFRWLLNQQPYIPENDDNVMSERIEIEVRKKRTDDLIARADRLIEHSGRDTIYGNLIDNRQGRTRHV